MRFRVTLLSLAFGMLVLPRLAHAQREYHYPRFDEQRIAERQMRAAERASRMADRMADRMGDRAMERSRERVAARVAERTADRISSRVGDRMANRRWDADRLDREMARQDRRDQARERIELRRDFGRRYRGPE